MYTQFLNTAAGIEADLTITRLAPEQFLVVTAAFTQTHVDAWIRNHIASGAFCTVCDVSDAYAMLNIQGPASRALLQAVSTDDFSPDAFPFATCREVRIGYQTALALRLTLRRRARLGTLRSHPICPAWFTDALIELSGKAHVASALRGYHALNSLRIEKAYRDWPHDIGPADTPLEAGLAFTCDWQKPGGFIGREALLALREAGLPRRRLVQFLLEDPEPMVYHNEPIFRDGKGVGFVTSGMYGHTLGAAVALGFVAHTEGCSDAYIREGRYEIELAERRIAARASLAPLYDPKNLRVRC